MLSLDLPISFLYMSKTLFKFSNIQLQQRIHFLRNTGFIHAAVQIQLLSSKSLILVNHHYGCLILLAQEKCSQVAWF